jgi:inhibitor of cysteine peptidase
LDFEGGFWGIIGDDGEHYDPINLDSEFRGEGLRIYFEAKIRTDLGSYHMWGKIVEILKIQKLE